MSTYWKIITDRPTEYSLERWGEFPNQTLLHSSTGKELGSIHSNTLVVWAGYKTDVCSPKFRILDLEFGTPDGYIDPKTGLPVTFRAALIHDCLYCSDTTITRAEADKIFYDLLKAEGFIWARFYFIVVRLLGGVWSLVVDTWRKLK